MKTIKYSKVDDGDISWGNKIDDFIGDMRYELQSHDAVKILLEPGDATRYTLILFKYENYLIIFNVTNEYCVHSGMYDVIDPNKMDEHINICTRHLMCELFRLIFNFGKGMFFDWEKGKAIVKDAKAK